MATAAHEAEHATLELRPDEQGAPFELSMRQQRLIQLQYKDAARVVVKKLHAGLWSLVLQTTAYDSAGRPKEPAVTKLDKAKDLAEEVEKHDSMSRELGPHAPRIIRRPIYLGASGVASTEYLIDEHETDADGAVVLELLGAGEHFVTFKELLLKALDTGVDSNNYCHIVFDDLYAVDGPVQRTRLANKPILGVAATATGGFVATELEDICREVASSMVPAQDPGHVADHSTYSVPASLLEAVTAAGPLAPRGDVTKQGAYFARSFVHECGEHVWGDAACAPLIALATELRSKVDDLDSSWLASWRPLQLVQHGDLNAGNVLLDARGKTWLIDFAFTGTNDPFSDAAKLISELLFVYLPSSDEVTMRHGCAVVDALIPADGARQLWEQPSPLSEQESTPAHALALSLAAQVQLAACYMVMSASRNARRRDERGGVDAADVHPAALWLPLLRKALRCLRFRDLNVWQKRTAWHAVQRLSTALLAALQRQPVMPPRMPPRIPARMEDEQALRALRAACPELQQWWQENEPRMWNGVKFVGARVQELNLEDCPLKALPDQIGQFGALTTLNLKGCSQLVALSAKIGKARALTSLSLNGCSKLSVLPLEIGELRNLRHLDLANTGQLVLLPGVTANAKETNSAQSTIAAYEVHLKSGTEFQARLSSHAGAKHPGGHALGGVNDAPTGIDKLGYTIYAKALADTARLVEGPRGPLCIGLYARWGCGKTFFWELIKDTLQSLALVETLDMLHMQARSGLPGAKEAFNKAMEQLCNPKWSPARMVDEDDRLRLEEKALEHGVKEVVDLRQVVVELVRSTSSLGCFTSQYERLATNDADSSLRRKKRQRDDAKKAERHAVLVIFLLLLWSLLSPLLIVMSIMDKGVRFPLLLLGTLMMVAPLLVLVNLLCRRRKPAVVSASESVSADSGDESKHEKRVAALLLDEAPIGVGEVHQQSVSCLTTLRYAALHAGQWTCRWLSFVLDAMSCVPCRAMCSDNDLPEGADYYVTFKFNAWVYHGSDLLWASLIKKLHAAQGTVLESEAKSYSEKFSRADMSESLGFMGKVKDEVEFLYDLLKTTYMTHKGCRRKVRLCVMVDDLDRCPKADVVKVLEAVILLLADDAPITCWLAVDSRVMVASIEAQYGQVFLDAGISGYEFLDKIVQLPFCLPNLELCKKSSHPAAG